MSIDELAQLDNTRQVLKAVKAGIVIGNKQNINRGVPARRVATEKEEFFSWDLNGKKEPARPRSNRQMYQAAGAASAKTLKLKVA